MATFVLPPFTARQRLVVRLPALRTPDWKAHGFLEACGVPVEGHESNDGTFKAVGPASLELLFVCGTDGSLLLKGAEDDVRIIEKGNRSALERAQREAAEARALGLAVKADVRPVLPPQPRGTTAKFSVDVKTLTGKTLAIRASTCLLVKRVKELI
jgi:hypothetical protein